VTEGCSRLPEWPIGLEFHKRSGRTDRQPGELIGCNAVTRTLAGGSESATDDGKTYREQRGARRESFKPDILCDH